MRSPPPIAPHIAAEKNNVHLSVEVLLEACQPVLRLSADVTIIEGVGGWQVPINDTQSMADFVKASGYPIIFVVGLRLGCINHTLLTWQSIKASGIPCSAWIANQIDPEMLVGSENIQTLIKWIDAPYLGKVDYQ